MNTIPPSPRTEYTPEQWERIYLASVDQAKRGYMLPQLPHDADSWTRGYEEFANKFLFVLKQRLKDAFNLDIVSDAYNDAHVLLRRAIHLKNASLISLYHRVIMDAEEPYLIRDAVEVFSLTNDPSQFTSEHLSAYTSIDGAVGESYGTLGEERAKITRVLAGICYERFSPQRVDAVISIFKRGFESREDVLPLLTEHESVQAPLMDGTL